MNLPAKNIKTILKFFLFRWEKTYKMNLTASEFLFGLEKAENKKRNIEGVISGSVFELLYVSNFAFNFPVQFPLLKVNGEITEDDNTTRLKIKAFVLPFVLIFLSLTAIFALIFFFLNNSKNSGAGGFSDSGLPLVFPLFGYGFLLFTFIIESVSCKDYFSRLICELERKKISPDHINTDKEHS